MQYLRPVLTVRHRPGLPNWPQYNFTGHRPTEELSIKLNGQWEPRLPLTEIVHGNDYSQVWPGVLSVGRTATYLSHPYIYPPYMATPTCQLNFCVAGGNANRGSATIGRATLRRRASMCCSVQ